MGFLEKTKIKAYTKLTVVMCCQIFYRKSVAPSSAIFGGDQRSNRPVDKIRNLERKKTCSKKINTPLPRPRPVQFISFQYNFYFATLRRLKVSWKKLVLGIRYHWEFFQKYKIVFGLMVN